MQQILQTFRERSAVSPAARKSVYVLESLLNAQHEFRTTQSAELPPQKRQRNGRSTLPSNRRNDLLKATIKGILVSTATARTDTSNRPTSTGHPRRRVPLQEASGSVRFSAVMPPSTQRALHRPNQRPTQSTRLP